MKNLFLKSTKIIVIVFSTLLIVKTADTILGLFLKKDTVLSSESDAIYKAPEFTFSVRTNSMGFRGPEPYIPKKEGVTRIAIIGDSFVYGWGVDYQDTWVYHLERKLNESYTGRKFEVINLGIPGASPYTYRETVAKYLPMLKPDYVFIALVEGNDFTQVVGDVDRSAKSASLDSQTIKSELFKVIHDNDAFLLTENFAKIQTLFPNLYKLTSSKVVHDVRKSFRHTVLDYVKLMGNEDVERFQNNISDESKNLYLYGNINPDLFIYALRMPDYFTKILTVDDTERRETMHNLYDLFDSIKQIGLENGSKIVLIDIPYGIFVDKKHCQTYQSLGFNYMENAWEADTPLEVILDIAKEAKIGVLVNLQEFRDKCTDDCFWQYDDHMTPKGNEILAENVATQFLSITSY